MAAEDRRSEAVTMKAMVASTHLTKFGFRYPENPLKDDQTDRVKACEIEVNRMATVDRSNGRYRILEIKTPKDRLEIIVSPAGFIDTKLVKRTDGKEKSKARATSH
jgi:hypothetical protein